MALSAALYAPTLAGGFLADDYTYLVSLGWWADGRRDGVPGARQLRRRHRRGQPRLSPAADRELRGQFRRRRRRSGRLARRQSAAPPRLRRGLLAAIAARFGARADAPGAARVAFGAAVAAAIFAAVAGGPRGRRPGSPGASTRWRFSSCCSRCWASSARRAGATATVSAAWRLPTGALASKESATLPPVLVLALAVAPPAALRGPRVARPRRTARGCLPVAGARRCAARRRGLLLLAAYFGWRIALFGTPFRGLPRHRSPSRRWSAATGWRRWARRRNGCGHVVRFRLARAALGAALAVVAGAGRRVVPRACGPWALALAGARRRPRGRRRAAAAAAARARSAGRKRPPVLLAAAALGAAGRGALAVAEPGRPWLWNRALRGVFVAATLVAVAAEAVLLHAALATWRTAGTQSKQLVAELARLPARLRRTATASCWSRTASAASPSAASRRAGSRCPRCSRRRCCRASSCRPSATSPWPENIRHGIVDALKRHPPREVWAAVAAGTVTPGGVPTDFLLLGQRRRAAGPSRLPLPSPVAGRGLAGRRGRARSRRAPCRDLAPLVPRPLTARARPRPPGLRFRRASPRPAPRR